jgi:predicted ester cyclase
MALIARSTAAGHRSRPRENLARNSFCAVELDAKASIASAATSRGTRAASAAVSGNSRPSKYSTFAAGWPDLRLEVAQVVAEDDWVMGRCVATATHTTAVMRIPPTGKQVVTTFWDLHRFDEAGLIVETWNLMDGLALMHQLGFLPAS